VYEIGMEQSSADYDKAAEKIYKDILLSLKLNIKLYHYQFSDHYSLNCRNTLAAY
jgi:hypothetical protein